MTYALVRDGEIVQEFVSVPNVLENISNFDAMSTEDQFAYGLREVIDNPPATQEFESHVRTLSYDLETDTVTANYAITLTPADVVRAAIWERIKEKRQRVVEGGVKVNVAGVDKWFHSDVYSRTQWLSMVILGANLPNTIYWKCMDNSFVLLTPTIVQQVFGAMLTKEPLAFANGEALHSAINAAEDPRTIDINVGWPEIYVAADPVD